MGTTIAEIQTAVGDIVTANKGLLKHPKSDEITKKALCFLENKERSYFKNIKQIKFEAIIIFAIYSELYKHKYYKTLPDWSELVNSSFQAIKNELTLENFRELLSKSKFVKERITPIFIVLKQRLVDDEMLKSVSDYISERNRYSSSNDLINSKAEERFWKYYDPARPNKQINFEKEDDEPCEDDNGTAETDLISTTDETSPQTEKNLAPWKYFLYRSCRWEENSYNKNKKINSKDKEKESGGIRTISLDAPQGDDDGSTLGGTLVTPEETDYTWLYDMLRDLIITNLKNMSTKNQLKFQLCFFTDDVSHLLNDSQQFYRYLRTFGKQYSPTINLDFLNFFVDYPCSALIDSYQKPRKPISQFNHRRSNDPTPCEQPLELCVYASFFNQTEQNISTQQGIYKERRERIFTEHYSEYV